jgi:glycosyltransferase involved in cell wall biosynthesis
MHTPRVTFFIPCYKLGHLLPQCVESMLAQTFQDFEILIMDDCSPDNTPEIARSFTDPRVRYVRNETNLGHLRNYNKAIEMASGEFIWLISADDGLRSPHILERYVAAMDANPRVGYAFCPGIGVTDRGETGIVPWTTLNQPDGVMPGRAFLRRLLQSNCVLAPSGMVRRACYDRCGRFPLDLPFAGDWFLWCAFALHFDVAYFAEPMVNYRVHDGSMTSVLIADDIRRLSQDDFAVRWRMHHMIEDVEDVALLESSRAAIVADYIASLTSKTWRGTKFRMSLAEFSRSLDENARSDAERDAIRTMAMTGVGPHLYWDPQLPTEREVYRLAIAHGGMNPKLWAKFAILCLGPVGDFVMKKQATLRNSRRGAA